MRKDQVCAQRRGVDEDVVDVIVYLCIDLDLCLIGLARAWLLLLGMDALTIDDLLEGFGLAASVRLVAVGVIRSVFLGAFGKHDKRLLLLAKLANVLPIGRDRWAFLLLFAMRRPRLVLDHVGPVVRKSQCLPQEVLDGCLSIEQKIGVL